MKLQAKDAVIMTSTFIAVFLYELITRLFTIGTKNDEYLLMEVGLIVMGVIIISGCITLIKSILPQKAGNIIYALLMVIVGIMYGAQIVYYDIFGTFFTIYSMFNGGEAFQFVDVIVGSIMNCIVPILLILITSALVVYLGVFKTKTWPKTYAIRKKILISILLIIVVNMAGYMGITMVKDSDPNSPYQYMNSVNELTGSVKCFGLFPAGCVDLWRCVFGFEPKLDGGDLGETVVGANDNVVEGLDFATLAKNEKDSTIKTMHKYFGSVKPTKKNDKTGIFEGKNLIFITGESFTDFAIDPKYTPTLYKLQNEGYTFTNFYKPVWGVSTLDGEYVNLQGLVPKPGVWSMRESGTNELPFTLGNQFTKLDYVSKAFHNHYAKYYDRHLSHPNLGYDYKGQGMGYSFTESWPESDLEMIDKTTGAFLKKNKNGEVEPFHVYYLTVSGHLNYTFSGNVIARENSKYVKDLDMSEQCKAYLACNIELDKAMELLLKRLEEAGQLENTVIALAGDHYPYGLDDKYISEFKGHKVDTTYEKYESAFILWSYGMEPETVDKVCSNMDILPTLSNMFGLEYDSRLLMGTDIFSDSEGLVMFKDKNWITSKGTRKELEKTDSAYVAKVDKIVADKFAYSALILDKNYYKSLKLK